MARQKEKSTRGIWPLLLWFPGMLGVLLAELAVVWPPQDAPLLALFGLAFPLSSFCLVAGTLGAFASRRWKAGAIGVLLLLWSGGHMLSTWGSFTCDTDPQTEGQTIKVLTWNVRQFNRYAWIESPGVRDSILDYLAQSNADVICLQECFLEDRRLPWMSKERLMAAAGLNHWQEEFKLGRGHDKLFGLAIMSRYPIAAKEAIAFDNDKNNSAMSVDIVANGDTLRVFNMHLSSIGFEKADYDATRNVGDEASRNRLLSRLTAAWSKRAVQAEHVAQAVQQSPHPVLLAGDFNDTPVSYSSHRLDGPLYDAFRGACAFKHPFLGATYVGELPFLRIDQVWASPELKTLSYETGTVEWSDHRPVQAVFAWDEALR